MKKLISFFYGVKKEMTKVKWPTKKEMTIYSSATLAFILIFALFFSVTDFVLAFFNSWMVK